ncbi:MAG: ATP-dependent DNA ligase [Balneolaceae bacterium]|nr:MAG: ATP-dependent DNA ligase [Balneolaceae bacterium]
MEICFRHYCGVLQKIGQTRSSNAKIKLFSDMIREMKSDRELVLAVRFAGEGAFESISGKRASAGSRTIGQAAAQFCEIDYDVVYKACKTATGSHSEAIERLMENLPAATVKRIPKVHSLTQISELFEQLRKISSRIAKQEFLQKIWSGMSGNEIKFFIRMLSQGSLRIGFETKSIEAAISDAWHRELQQVRYAHMITGSLGETAVMARAGTLNEAVFRLFHPLSFMLAAPLEIPVAVPLENYVAEEKFDGMRAQVHADGKVIRLYSRDKNDITSSFPDLTQFFTSKEMPPTVLDGEICVYIDGKIQPFQQLQKRMGLKKPGKKILSDSPALFIAYDLLYTQGRPVFDLPLNERRVLLENQALKYHLPVSKQFRIYSENELEQSFEKALLHGNEGLMLKLETSRYEYGQRRKSWLKVKKPGGSIDTIVMYAHAGSGKRGGTYSDFTLGVRVSEDERYEEEFIPIGKAYGGYSDEELRKMNRRIKELTVEKYGPTLGLLPGLVVEIEFDDIVMNRRTKAGYTLRFPRFRTIRWDLRPEDVNTLRDVELLYRQKTEKAGLSNADHHSFFIPSANHFLS